MKKVLRLNVTAGRIEQTGDMVEATDVSTTPGPGLIPQAGSDGTIDPNFLPPSSGMINPMTNAGDLIVGTLAAASNVALYSLGARATTNSSYHSSDPNNTIDGNDATFHDGGGPVANAWIVVDLQAPVAVGAWRLHQVPWTADGGTPGVGNNSEHADSYKLQSSDDNSTWVDRFTYGSAAPDDSGNVFFGSAITARYWRVYALTGGNWGWDIYTFALYTVTPGVDRLPIGDETQVLTVVDGAVAWADSASGGGGGGGGSNPMTATGDMIVGAGTAYTNVALTSLGAIASDNGTYTTYVPDFAFDADDTTQWFGNQTYTSFLEIDLGAAHTITAWRMLHAGTNWYRNFELQSSVDGTTWITQADQYLSGVPPIDTGLLILASAVTARYWRLYTTTASYTGNSYGWGVKTFALYTGGTAGEMARLPIGSDDQIMAVIAGTPGWIDQPGNVSTGGSPIIIPGLLANPDIAGAHGASVAYEFDSGSLFTWSAAVLAEDINTSFPSHYRILTNTNTDHFGYYAFAPGSGAFDARMKLSHGGGTHSGIPSAYLYIGNSDNSRRFLTGFSYNGNKQATPVAYKYADGYALASPGYSEVGAHSTWYLRIVYDGSVWYNAYLSFDGITWHKLTSSTSFDEGFTIARLGILLNGDPQEVAIDWLRVS